MAIRLRRQFSPAIFLIALSLFFNFCPQAEAVEKKALVQGIADRVLREEIERAIGESPLPAKSRIEARKRAHDAADNAEKLLRSEGYYDAQIAANLTEDEHFQAVVQINPGPRTSFSPFILQWIDPVPEDKAITASRLASGLNPGAPARSEDVLQAQGRMIASLQNLGYADAQAELPDVVVDHANNTMTVTFKIKSGSQVRMGDIKFTNRKNRTNPKFIRKLVSWKVGDIYRPKTLANMERELLDTGVYDNVTVSLDTVPNKSDLSPELRPVLVNLAERSHHALDFSAGYSTSEGVDFDTRLSDFNRFGRADTLTYEARFGKIDNKLGVEWAAPHFFQIGETLKTNADIFRTVSPAYTEQGGIIGASLTRRFFVTSYATEGISITDSLVDNYETAKLRLVILRFLGALALDYSDNPLDPHKGWKMDIHVTPSFISGDKRLIYVKTMVGLSTYFSVNNFQNDVLAAHVALGSIPGGSIPSVPSSDRFFGGGGGSVRGYAYQAIGPHYADNKPVGGLSLFNSSLEVRHRFGQSPFGIVGFFDAGSIGSSLTPQLSHVDTAIGFGLRYYLAFAPIRVDCAFPLEKASPASQQPIQLYISIGQSF